MPNPTWKIGLKIQIELAVKRQEVAILDNKASGDRTSEKARTLNLANHQRPESPDRNSSTTRDVSFNSVDISIISIISVKQKGALVRELFREAGSDSSLQMVRQPFRRGLAGNVFNYQNKIIVLATWAIAKGLKRSFPICKFWKTKFALVSNATRTIAIDRSSVASNSLRYLFDMYFFVGRV